MRDVIGFKEANCFPSKHFYARSNSLPRSGFRYDEELQSPFQFGSMAGVVVVSVYVFGGGSQPNNSPPPL